MDETSSNLPTSFHFKIPENLTAKEPPEKRGVLRDQVRLMITHRANGKVTHTNFNKLGDFLEKDDLLVFNSSRTLPASLKGCKAPQGPCMEVRLAQHFPDDSWLALILCQHGDPFGCGLHEGMTIDFGMDLIAEVEKMDDRIPRLWKLHFSKKGSEFIDLIYRIGQPIRYDYISYPLELDYYQTVFAKDPGSSEMPSAGRAFTWKMLFELKQQGIGLAYITLHTGLSSYADDLFYREHPVSEEEYFISKDTADKINATLDKKGKIIAIGTTVVRALESSVTENNRVEQGHRYTRLHITGSHKLQIVDGILTGFHEPEASHLDLLNAFLSAHQINSAYEQAINRGYLWHEFGDLNLIV